MNSATATIDNHLRFIYRPSDTIELPPVRRSITTLQAKTDNMPEEQSVEQEGQNSITEFRPVSDKVFEEAERILALYHSDYDADESSERLAFQLGKFVREHKSQAITALSNIIIQQEERLQDTICDTLQALGRLGHPFSYQQRLWLLEKMLQSGFARVRYGAVLGLAYLRDEHSIPYIMAAAGKEVIPELKATFNDVVLYLERKE